MEEEYGLEPFPELKTICSPPAVTISPSLGSFPTIPKAVFAMIQLLFYQASVIFFSLKFPNYFSDLEFSKTVDVFCETSLRHLSSRECSTSSLCSPGVRLIVSALLLLLLITFAQECVQECVRSCKVAMHAHLCFIFTHVALSVVAFQ